MKSVSCMSPLHLKRARLLPNDENINLGGLRQFKEPLQTDTTILFNINIKYYPCTELGLRTEKPSTE